VSVSIISLYERRYAATVIDVIDELIMSVKKTGQSKKSSPPLGCLNISSFVV